MSPEIVLPSPLKNEIVLEKWRGTQMHLPYSTPDGEGLRLAPRQGKGDHKGDRDRGMPSHLPLPTTLKMRGPRPAQDM
jgi:hypothetical protein